MKLLGPLAGPDANIYAFNELHAVSPREELHRSRAISPVIKTNEFPRFAGLVAAAALFSRAASIIFLRYNRTIGDDKQVSGQDESSFIRITKIKFTPCL